MRWAGDKVTAAQVLYRNYIIELESDNHGWRAVAATHSTNGKIMLAREYHPDQTTAERHAKAAIDWQLAGRSRRDR